MHVFHTWIAWVWLVRLQTCLDTDLATLFTCLQLTETLLVSYTGVHPSMMIEFLIYIAIHITEVLQKQFPYYRST